MRHLVLAFGLALGALSACRPNPAQTASTAPETQPGERHRFLAVYLGGQQVGGVETTMHRLPDGGLQVRDRFSFSIQRVNGESVDTFALDSRSVTEYGPDDTLRWEESTQTEAGVVEKHHTRIDDKALVLRYDGPGQSFEKRFDLPDGFRSSRAVYFDLVQRFERAGAKDPVELAYHSFDSDEQRFVAKTMRITARRDVKHGKQTLTAFDVVDRTEDGTVVTLLADRDYLPITLDMFGTFTAKWVDEPPFGQTAVAKITSEIPVAGKIAKWWELEQMELEIEVAGDDATLPSLFRDNHYHQVERRPNGGTYRVTLHDTRPPLDPETTRSIPELPLRPDEDVARFLEPSPLSQSDDPAIQAAARRIVGEEKNSLLAGARVVQWVFENLEKKGGVRGSATATEVLAVLAGDCTEHAALTVALARAVGLPARNVDGIVLVGGPDDTMMAGYHAWAEIWIGRWIAVDAVFAEVGTSARYLAFGYNEPGEAGSAASLSRTIGKLKITIEGYKLFGEKPVRLR